MKNIMATNRRTMKNIIATAAVVLALAATSVMGQFSSKTLSSGLPRTIAELDSISRNAYTNLTTSPASIQVIKDLVVALKSEDLLVAQKSEELRVALKSAATPTPTNLTAQILANAATRTAYNDTILSVQGILDGEMLAPPMFTQDYGKGSYWFGYQSTLSWVLFVKDSNDINSLILANVNRFYGSMSVHPVVMVTNASTAKKVLIHDLCLHLIYQNGAPMHLIGPAKRLEIIERRASGLSVVGPDSLPKTKAMTTAINNGKGLLEALQAFVGNELPNLGAVLARKVADMQALKEQINTGLKDPTPADIALIGSWLGIEPTAAWVKQYNGQ
jgi:lambda repressor-like predicted transcriptional regulator